MTPATGDVLLIGYGNPGRLDDGLGPAVAETLRQRNLPGLTVEADYQLTVEDAAEVARHGLVIFADADRTGPEPFSVRRVVPAATGMSFSSHSVSAEAVMALSRDLFGASVEAWMLGIRGYEFDAFGERLSARAQDNLAVAVKYIEQAIREQTIREIRAGRSGPEESGQAPTG